ncbi:MAG: hypothetical protein ABI560_06330, partial [Myxococcales bacterium]
IPPADDIPRDEEVLAELGAFDSQDDDSGEHVKVAKPAKATKPDARAKDAQDDRNGGKVVTGPVDLPKRA